MSNPLKPLYANLKRLRIGDFLSTKEFELQMLEKDLDEAWHQYLQMAEAFRNIIPIGFSPYNHDEALFKWMSDMYANKRQDFSGFLFPILLSFASWAKVKLDFTHVLQSLNKLGLKEEEMLEFVQELNDIQIKKIVPAKATISKISDADISQSKETPSKKVFIVHGWDEVALLQLETLLKEEFSLEPVIMKNKPNETVETIIVKFERLAKDCDAAIVLMSPDDKGEQHFRARQNVVFELGWFLGKFFNESPRRIIILKKGDIEIPSDIHGVLYQPYNNHIKEIFYDLKLQFKMWNMI